MGMIPDRECRYQRLLRSARRRILEDALARHGGNVVAAAGWLGIDHGGMYRQCKKLGIDLADLRKPGGAAHGPLPVKKTKLTGWLGNVAAGEADHDDSQ